MNKIDIGAITKASIIKDLILILIVLVLGKLILEMISRLIKRAFDDKMDQDGYRKVRIETLSKNLYSVVKFILGFIIVMIILDMIGVNTRSIIATAGIGGVAIAFGAQTLVKDIVTGMIIIIDDTYRVGDWIIAAGVEGTVETLGMRYTKIRDYDGSVHTIPNSQITNVKNLNDGPIRFECNIYLSYDVTNKQLEEMVESVSKKLREDEKLSKFIIEDVSLFGIMEMNQTSYLAKTTGIAKPGYQWALAREERKLLIEEMQEKNIKTSTQVIASTKGMIKNEEI